MAASRSQSDIMSNGFSFCRMLALGLGIAVCVSLFSGGSVVAVQKNLDLSDFWRSVFKRPDHAAATLASDPTIAGKIELGRRFFEDPRLSGGNDSSCASCHKPALAFTDGLARALGSSGTPLKRNTPTLFNLAWSPRFNWDGSVTSLESQAVAPITRPTEMNGTFGAIIEVIQRDPELSKRFRQAFGSVAVTKDLILSALASYVRSLISPKTRFDAWIEGDNSALSETEVAGFRLFVGAAGCVSCHAGWRFTDDELHDIGLDNELSHGGRLKAQNFKTPGLRELSRSAPYMHDGSMGTLEQVVDHYVDGFVDRPSLSSNMSRGLVLEDDEKSALVAFLLSLSSNVRP